MFIFGLLSILVPIFMVKIVSAPLALKVILSAFYSVISLFITISMVGETEFLSKSDERYAEKYSIDDKWSVIPLNSAISLCMNMALLTLIPSSYGIVIMTSLFLLGLIAVVNYTRKTVHQWNTVDYEELSKPTKNILKINILYTSYNYVFCPVQSLVWNIVSYLSNVLSKFEFNIIKSAKGDYD